MYGIEIKYQNLNSNIAKGLKLELNRKKKCFSSRNGGFEDEEGLENATSTMCKPQICNGKG